ncbi:hypothetical protein DFR65_102430 [Oceanihabitans sediminis]|uniref:Uncharacterized protein n=1 Tax=Oceanihabitans sediminis TaxID=1812012 RepID=A0A368P686_9FLAO|nr:hypothetical protein [Oceanihabitans sediminis]RBP33094.1 hypothetical protein DFR65_102430 [Oceanihabitans sediminis]RCU57395.1 hypothetical protein DU428_06265 [Oceanihabitans sediminis]
MSFILVPLSILILALPLYFLSKWGLNKLYLGKEENRKYIAMVPTLFLSSILYVAVVYLWFFSISYYPNNDFNQQIWDENTTERYKISQDIFDSKMLIGKTKEEVIDLLGQDFYSYNVNHIAYNLGFVPGLFSMDPDVLDVYIEKGIVVKVSQHQT